jgi:Glycosyltransferase family 87
VPTRQSWWELLRPPLTGVAAVLLLSLGAAVVLGHAGVWRNTVDERHGQDFGIFLASVRHAVEGRSLYTPTYLRSATTGRRITGPPNLNLPHTLVLLLPLAWLSSSAALAIWIGASLLSFLACARESLRALQWRRIPWLASLLIVVYLLAWAPAAAFTLTAQISLLLMWPVCKAWLAARDGRSRAAGAWLGVAAAIKPFLLLFVPYWLLRRDWAALLPFAASAGAVLLVGLLTFGPGAYLEWLRQLPQVSWAGHYLNASWLSIVQRALGGSDYAAVISGPDLVRPIAFLGTALIGVVTLLRLTGGNTPDLVDRDWAVLLLAALLMSPLGWSYYVWLALWPVAALIGHRRPWRSPREHDGWLAIGLLGWLWWGRMSEWGQPHPMATLVFASMYFWALAALWVWSMGEGNRGTGNRGTGEQGNRGIGEWGSAGWIEASGPIATSHPALPIPLSPDSPIPPTRTGARRSD